MPAPRGPHARHERNLERMLEAQGAEPGPVHQARGPARGGFPGTDVAAKLAREAAEREAARRSTEGRPGDTGVT
jgi:hypothetical protein